MQPPAYAFWSHREVNEWQGPPGKLHRKRPTLLEIAEMFPSDERARKSIEELCWPDGPFCPPCGTFNVRSNIKHKTATHRCSDSPNKTTIPATTFTRFKRVPHCLRRSRSWYTDHEVHVFAGEGDGGKLDGWCSATSVCGVDFWHGPEEVIDMPCWSPERIRETFMRSFNRASCD